MDCIGARTDAQFPEQLRGGRAQLGWQRTVHTASWFVLGFIGNKYKFREKARSPILACALSPIMEPFIEL